MKRSIPWILLACFLLGLTGCAERVEEPVSQPAFSEPYIEKSKEPEAPQGDEPLFPTDTTQEHILIAYFSWADNTVAEDEEAAVQSALAHYESIGDRKNYSEVDAVASASVVIPGNTAKMAQWIQEYVGGDLFPITVAEPYPDNYDECLDRAADEQAKNVRPELAAHLDNLEDYDVIFLGFPNWWYSAPMAVFSFIEEYDLSGKTIVPFCSHGTGGIAGSVRDITAVLPDSAEVLEALGVYRADINHAQPVVNEWLDRLGFEKINETAIGNDD